MDLSDSENAQGDVGVEKGQGVFVAHPGGTGPSAGKKRAPLHRSCVRSLFLFYCGGRRGRMLGSMHPAGEWLHDWALRLVGKRVSRASLR